MEAGTEGTRRSQRRELQRGTAVKSTTKLANQSSRTRFGEEVGCLVGRGHVNEAEGAVIYGLLTKPVELAIQMLHFLRRRGGGGVRHFDASSVVLKEDGRL